MVLVRPTAQKVLADAGVSEDTRVRDLTEDELNKIREIIDKLKVEGDLRREISLNIKRLMEIGCYRGITSSSWFTGSWTKYEKQCTYTQRSS